MLHDRVKTTREFVQSMVSRPLSEEEMAHFAAQLSKTATSVAVLLDYDGTIADYSAEARAIDGKLPVLNVLADPGWHPAWAQDGRRWLAQHAPHAAVEAFGLHMMFWEFPDRFNRTLGTFLERVR